MSDGGASGGSGSDAGASGGSGSDGGAGGFAGDAAAGGYAGHAGAGRYGDGPSWSGGSGSDAPATTSPYDYQPPPTTAGYPAYGQPPYGYPPYGYPVPATRTNGLAIASLVLGIAGIAACQLCGPVGAIMGHVARRRIRESGEEGDGMALAGIITGWIATGILVLILVVYGVVIALAIGSDSSADPSYHLG